MPNWVFNENVFYSTNKKNIQDFYLKLTKWASEPAMKYKDIGFHPSKWLGNILTSAGFPYQEVIDGKHGRCRGEIGYISNLQEVVLDDKTYSFFIVSTVTAWQQMSLMWLNILKKHYGENNNIGLAFTSDEESSEFFEMYNPENILRLIGYSGKEKYVIHQYFDIAGNYDFDELNEKQQEILAYIPEDEEMVATEKQVATMISGILDKNIISESLNENSFQEYMQECNKILNDMGIGDGSDNLSITSIHHIQNLYKEV